jgi:hypothetical protein
MKADVLQSGEVGAADDEKKAGVEVAGNSAGTCLTLQFAICVFSGKKRRLVRLSDLPAQNGSSAQESEHAVEHAPIKSWSAYKKLEIRTVFPPTSGGKSHTLLIAENYYQNIFDSLREVLGKHKSTIRKELATWVEHRQDKKWLQQLLRSTEGESEGTLAVQPDLIRGVKYPCSKFVLCCACLCYQLDISLVVMPQRDDPPASLVQLRADYLKHAPTHEFFAEQPPNPPPKHLFFALVHKDKPWKRQTKPPPNHFVLLEPSPTMIQQHKPVLMLWGKLRDEEALPPPEDDIIMQEHKEKEPKESIAANSDSVPDDFSLREDDEVSVQSERSVEYESSTHYTAKVIFFECFSLGQPFFFSWLAYGESSLRARFGYVFCDT